MARKTKEDSLATRESVLLAALDLFCKNGYSHTTLQDIADQIGMSRGAVYWHFENKSALLAALIDFVHLHNKQRVGVWISDIHSIAQLRDAFVAYARLVAEDEITRKFEFLMNFQMEWSEELLTETNRQLNEMRENPLDEFKKCFADPSIAACLHSHADVDALVLSLAALWAGMCKLYLGRCPGISLGQCSDADLERLSQFDLAKSIGEGFDLILGGVLKTN